MACIIVLPVTGMFYKDKTVVVVGGGNSAAADALLLSRICKKVILVHRRDELRATKIYHQSLMQAENVEFQWNQTVESVLESIVADDGHDGRQGRRFSGGRNHVQITGVRLKNAATGEKQEIVCDGIFVSVGREPETRMIENQVVLDENGYIIADESTKTNLRGVFAVGRYPDEGVASDCDSHCGWQPMRRMLWRNIWRINRNPREIKTLNCYTG